MTILVRSVAKDTVYGTDVISWVEQATVWAQVQDALPGKAYAQAGEIPVAERPARVRMRWRSDVTQENRLSIAGRAGTWRIVAGPAEMGRREGLELMIEQMSTEGQQA